MTAPVVLSVLSNTYGNAFLQRYLAANGAWVALHVDQPTVLGDPTTELAGGDYIRQRGLFHPPANKTIVTSNAQTFVGLIASVITWIAFWDSLAGGDMIAAIPLANPIAVAASGHFLCAAGDLGLTV